MADHQILRLRTALQTVVDWMSDEGTIVGELYAQGILEQGDMPEWDGERDSDE